MTDMIYWVLNMSISGTIVALAVFLFGKIRKIPRRVYFLLWALPALRLLIPFSVGSKLSLFGLPGKYSPKAVELPLPAFEGKEIDFTAMNSMQLADSYFPVTFESTVCTNFFSNVAIIYLIIVSALFLTVCALALMSGAEMKSAKHIGDNIYLSDSLLSPAVFGIIRPRIILPSYLQGEDNRYILMHEQAHIKRHDNLWRTLAIVICCIHWFNPIVWLLLGRFLEALELACDEKVLAVCGEDKKKDYARAIIGCEEKKTVFISSFGGAKTRVRIKKILSYKKLSLFSAVSLAIFTFAVAVMLMTNSL